MVIGIKDSAKLAGISVVSACAVFVCTLFMNFSFDIALIKSQINSEQIMMFYDAQVSTAKVVNMVTGGCLLLTSVVMLFFYIKNYIDTHKKELGILKALGYSNIKIAKKFWIFGISVLVGTSVGFSGAFLLMPYFYELQNADHILPEIIQNFHPPLLIYLVVIPTLAFSALSVLYSCIKLRLPVLSLIKESLQSKTKYKKRKEKSKKEYSFIEDLKRSTLRTKRVLVFFMIFAAFCFSAMTQMSFSMDALSSAFMGAMIMLIGIVLAVTTLFLATTTVINGNKKTISMMQVFGYSQKECTKSLLGGYRPMAYIGFAAGTVYQYLLLKIMVTIVFKDIENVPEYNFDFWAFIISLVFFAAAYEIIMAFYSRKIRSISVKEIMVD